MILHPACSIAVPGSTGTYAIIASRFHHCRFGTFPVSSYTTSSLIRNPKAVSFKPNFSDRNDSMQSLETIHDYLRCHSDEIGQRILFSYPSLHGPDETPSSLISRMLRTPYPAQALAIMGIRKRWQLGRNANVIAECGAGMLVHSAGNPFCGLVMCPPHLVEKWARETFLTLPAVRVFLIDDMRNGGNPREPHGVNEVRLRRGEIVREGLHTSLAELRRLGRKGWRRLCPSSTVFCIGREKAKLSYFWKHCYAKSRSGRYRG